MQTANLVCRFVCFEESDLANKWTATDIDEDLTNTESTIPFLKLVLPLSF